MSTGKFNTRAALRAHLDTLAGLPSVHWENQHFEPQDGLPFLRETMMPADEPLTANNERTAFGVYQLDVFIPTGTSISAGENLADSIKELFRPAQIVSGVKLEKAVVLQGSLDPPWYIIPVRVDYRVHQQNTGA